MRLVYLAIFIAVVLIVAKIVFPNIKPQASSIPPITPAPTKKIYTPIEHYSPPRIKKSDSYTMIFVGDSMTDVLGPNMDALRTALKGSYPNTTFGLFNYGFGSTNILSVQNRLEEESTYNGHVFPSILGRYFDIIIIESMGHNPLSQFTREEGLKKQTAALDQIVTEIVDTHPDSLIIFMATLAPSRTMYAKGVADLNQNQRNIWVDDRVNYIENHINYARSHNIPLIDIYHQSLDKNGNAILKYIDHSNYIHPSAEGIKLISNAIADYLKENNILP